MASWRSAPHPATWWLCSRTWTHPKPTRFPSSSPTGCPRGERRTVAAFCLRGRAWHFRRAKRPLFALQRVTARDASPCGAAFSARRVGRPTRAVVGSNPTGGFQLQKTSRRDVTKKASRKDVARGRISVTVLRDEDTSSRDVLS